MDYYDNCYKANPTFPPQNIHMILGIFSPTPTSLGEKMPKLSGILCDDNDDDDRDVVGCGDGGISLPGGCTRVSLILSPRDHSHCDDGDQHSLVSLMLKGRYCNFFYHFVGPVGHNIWWENS